MKIAIIGAGAFGTALGGILAEKSYDIDYYDPRIERERLSDVVEAAKYVVIAVPSNAVARLLPHLGSDKTLIIATKGLLTEQMFGKFDKVMALSGPGFAAEIKNHVPTKLTATDEKVIELFGTDYLEFDRTDDLRGVLMCGALKNVYAIGAGLRNLERGSAAFWQYITEVSEEMKALLSANGADQLTVDLQCGTRDLELTAGLPSRNFEFGLKLRQDLAAVPDKTVEGVSTARRIRRGEIKVPKETLILKELLKIWD